MYTKQCQFTEAYRGVRLEEFRCNAIADLMFGVFYGHFIQKFDHFCLADSFNQ